MIFFNVLFANSLVTKIDVWKTFNDIEANYSLMKKETDPLKSSKILENNLALYKDIYNNLKFNYEYVNTLNNTFNTINYKEINSLQSKINANQIHGNNLQAHRDIFLVNQYKLKENLTQFVLTLNNLLSDRENRK